jgi:acyl dehydratase
LTDYVGAGQVRNFKVRFATIVWPGDTVTCRGKVTKKYQSGGERLIEGDLEVVNQKGEVAVKSSFRAAAD